MIDFKTTILRTLYIWPRIHHNAIEFMTPLLQIYKRADFRVGYNTHAHIPTCWINQNISDLAGDSYIPNSLPLS